MASSSAGQLRLEALAPFKPELKQRAWASIPHPTLPLLATCHSKVVTVYSLTTLSAHSTLASGHTRSVRSAAWKPGLAPHKLCLVTASFDSTAAVWRWDGDNHPLPQQPNREDGDDVHTAATAASSTDLEVEITASAAPATHTSALQSRRVDAQDDGDDADSTKSDDWEYVLVLEGHESEVKSVAFSPAGQFLATCSRDKSVWIWEDVGANEDEDEWETVAVLNEHEGDVKSLAWCPDVPGRTAKGKYGRDVLASCSYDNTVRIWREDGDGEWACVAVLEGHDGTVWGVTWEANPRRTRFPRLMTFSADKTIRIWTMTQDDEDEGEANGDGRNPMFQDGLGGIPNRMRASVREEWTCTAILPAVHKRDVYSAAWSPSTGLVASTGGDGVIAIYREEPEPIEPGDRAEEVAGRGEAATAQHWRVLTKVTNAHGPYEINHITWCRRFDPGSEDRGVEEMLVTTGDNGIIKPWKILNT